MDRIQPTYHDRRRREMDSSWLTEQADDAFTCYAEMTVRQQAERWRRVRAHARRVQREMESMGLIPSIPK